MGNVIDQNSVSDDQRCKLYKAVTIGFFSEERGVTSSLSAVGGAKIAE